MRYAIYGVNRVSKDFLYIFKDIEVTCFFEDVVICDTFCGKKVYLINDIQYIKESFEKIIICDFEKEKRVRRLKELGVTDNQYVFEEEFFTKLDEKKINPDNKPVVVWGVGRAARKLFEWNSNLEVKGYVDTYLGGQGQKFNGKEVLLPSELEESSFVLVAVRQNEDIINNLERMGLEHWIDYCTDVEYKSTPSEMLRKTIFDKSCYDLDCKTMLNHVEIGMEGMAICCCSTFIYHSIGTILEQSVDDVWHSIVHRIMCLSNVNHTYSFCIKEMCPFFIHCNQKELKNLYDDYEDMENRPTTVAVGFDATCNLKCITCRKDYYVSCDSEQAKLEVISSKIKKDLLPSCEFYISAGNGETLMGRQYRDLLSCIENKDTKCIRLLSNGLLFNEKNWKKIRESTNAKIIITISIDAACKDTYEKVRRGGNFDLLKRNMEFAASLRKKGELSYMRLNFVVQKMNYKEMPDFVKWGLELGVDEVFFTKILNWGTYTDEEFKDISMMEEDGVTPKRELQEVLSLPIMHEKIVDLGTIQYGRMDVEVGKKENYYRWELERKVRGLFEY